MNLDSPGRSAVAAGLVIVSALGFGCGGPGSDSRSPTAPSVGSTNTVAADTPSSLSGLSASSPVSPSTTAGPLPEAFPLLGDSGPAAITFPPRSEPLLFRTALEAKYRDGLRRPASTTFVDQEGTVVWTQEYLRYRVNLCGHVEAVFRVFRQIDGFGVQPTCGDANSATFPPRNEPLDFMVQLEAKYRDGLRRPALTSFVDVEGNIVWTQEYLRYRVSTCTHINAQQKVFDQIDGRGVQGDCTPAPTTTAPTLGGFVTLTVIAGQCGCVVGPIQVRANGDLVGSLSCPQRSSFSIRSGSSVSVCDNTGCFGSTFALTGARTLNLVCSSSARQIQ